MSHQLVTRFIDGLWKLEANRDIDRIAQAFAEDCDVSNVTGHTHFHGRDGAARFWSKYRDAFRDIRSTFRNIIVGEDCAALEWTTEGTSLDGHPINYSGVSILEMGADGIKRFQAYFDVEELGRQMAGAKGKKSIAHYI